MMVLGLRHEFGLVLQETNLAVHGGLQQVRVTIAVKVEGNQCTANEVVVQLCARRDIAGKPVGSLTLVQEQTTAIFSPRRNVKTIGHRQVL